jgi:carboxypeptidase Taq
MELAHRAAEIIGFDFNHGRLDTSTHPFTNGNQFDTRITTRFNENSVAENIAISLHEGGHGLYQQGLPKEDYGTPLGKSRELSIHESQSRLWENHVGRSKAFWEYFVGEMRDISSEFDEVTPERCYKAVNSVDFENVIRTEADEISYHLHVVLRFELGQMLINGEIDVNDLPELWNDKMEEYLGVRPEDDAEGVLQDIHWSWGSFGYFPTYSLGTVFAAQLHSKAEEEIENLDRKISDGETEPLLNWLRENIHSKGQLRRTDDLIKEVTGEPLTADYLMEHLRSRYGQIHEIEF